MAVAASPPAGALAQRCAGCGSQGTLQPHLGDLRRCTACGHAVAAEVPSPEALAALYDAGYFDSGEYFDYVADRGAAEANFRRNIGVLRRYARDGGRLLEIGSAYGFFLALARRFWQVEGVDVTAEGVRYAREVLGLPVREAEFLDLDLPAAAYDVVCLWDTIEHLREPERYVAKIAHLLRPGGILALTTGDIGSRVARLQGRGWRLIHPPTHLHYFTRASIRALLDRHGLEVREISYPAQHRSVRMVLHGLLGARLPWLSPTLRRFSGVPGPGLSFPLNLRDIMLVVAEKRPPPPAPAGAAPL